MNRQLLRSPFIAASLVASVLAPAAVAQQEQGQRLVIAGYPDATEWVAMDVLRRVADLYEQQSPGVTVELKPGLSCAEGREMVLAGEAACIVISEQKNLIRAYHAQTDKKRGFSELRLDKFYPAAKRVIRSEQGIIGEFRLGLATHEVTEPLAQFLTFLSTAAAQRAVLGVPYVEPVQRRDDPVVVRKVLYRYEAKPLAQPVLVY